MDEIFYSDLALLPFDEVEEDGDDSVHQNQNPIVPTKEEFELWAQLDHEASQPDFTGRALMSAAPRRIVYVPFKRQLKQGMVGPDVKAVHRALRVAAGERPGTPTRLFGPYMKKRLIAFQKKKRLQADGVYGLASHKALSPYFDSYGRWLMGQTKILSTQDQKRQVIVATGMHGYNNRYNIHYTQSGLRMQGVRQRIKPPGYPRYEDCSSFSTWLYWVAGMPDPNGLGYNGYGYTGTFAAHGRRISTAEMKPGDAIFYGSYPHGHMTIYIGNGRCVSHGNERGPSILAYNYRTPNQIRTYF